MFSYSHNILEQLAVCVMLAPPAHDDWDALIQALVAVDKSVTPQKASFSVILAIGKNTAPTRQSVGAWETSARGS